MVEYDEIEETHDDYWVILYDENYMFKGGVRKTCNLMVAYLTSARLTTVTRRERLCAFRGL